MAYYLREYTPVKSNYKVYNKEWLIIMHCLKIWNTELQSVLKGFDIITNYKNIEYFIEE